MDKYVPPYDITEEMLELTAEITEDLGKLSNVNDLERLPRLRRVNRIKSIQSSLAIENKNSRFSLGFVLFLFGAAIINEYLKFCGNENSALIP